MCAWAHRHCSVETHPKDSRPCTFSTDMMMLLYVSVCWDTLTLSVLAHLSLHIKVSITRGEYLHPISLSRFPIHALVPPCCFILVLLVYPSLRLVPSCAFILLLSTSCVCISPCHVHHHLKIHVSATATDFERLYLRDLFLVPGDVVSPALHLQEAAVFAVALCACICLCL